MVHSWTYCSSQLQLASFLEKQFPVVHTVPEDPLGEDRAQVLVASQDC